LPGSVSGEGDGWPYVFLSDAPPRGAGKGEDVWEVDVADLELEPDFDREMNIAHSGLDAPRWWMHLGPISSHRLNLLER
jgi:hypothetical protein